MTFVCLRDRPRGQFDNYLYFTNDAWAEEIDRIIGERG